MDTKINYGQCSAGLALIGLIAAGLLACGSSETEDAPQLDEGIKLKANAHSVAQGIASLKARAPRPILILHLRERSV